MDSIVIVATTCSSMEEASHLAKEVIEKRLVACCQVIPNVHSYYIWKGETTSSQEVVLQMKTFPFAQERLVRYVQEHHSYELPEIIVYQVSCASEAYMMWMHDLLVKKEENL